MFINIVILVAFAMHRKSRQSIHDIDVNHRSSCATIDLLKIFLGAGGGFPVTDPSNHGAGQDVDSVENSTMTSVTHSHDSGENGTMTSWAHNPASIDALIAVYSRIT